MDEVDVINMVLNKAKNADDLIRACKLWREVIVDKLEKDLPEGLRQYQIPLSDKIIEYVFTDGIRGNEIISLWSRQSGKTTTVSVTVLIIGTFYIIFLNEYFNTGLFAPVESMITHVTRNKLRKFYKVLRKYLSQYGIKLIAGEGQQSSLFVLENMRNECEFNARSLSVGEHAEIIGETFKLLIIEQSELVNAMKMKNDVFPMGAEKGGVRVLTGTTSPYFKNEYFRQAIEKWNPDPTKNKSTADFVECIDWKTAANSSKAYKRYVERELERMGEDSIEFQTQFGLIWVGTKLKFIGYEDLAGLEEDYEWSNDRLRFFGIDVAQAGDSTVVTVIEIEGGKREDGAVHKHTIGWLELEGINYDDQIPKIVNFLSQYKPLRFGYIDIVSLGKPVYDILKRRLVEIDPETNRPTYWARLSGYYGTVNENHNINQATDREFQHGTIHYPKNTRFRREKSRFIDQILDLERKYVGSKLKLEHPDIKGRHDDYYKSLGLAVWAYKDKSFKPGITHVEL